MQYQHASLRSRGVWTVEQGEQAEDQFSALFESWKEETNG